MALVDHVLPGRDGGSELPVGRGDTWLLIKVDLPRQRFPANPRDLVVFEEESSADCHPPGELKRRAVKDEQVHPRGEQHIEGVRRAAAEVHRDVYISIGAAPASDAAAVQVREVSSRLPEHGNSLSGHGFERLVHASRLADTPAGKLKTAVKVLMTEFR